MFKKISKIFLTTFLLLGSVGTLASCNLQNSNNTDDPTPPVVNPIKENEVKIRSIKAVETVIEEEVEEQNTVSKMSARRLNSYVLTLSDEDETTDVEIPGSEITEPETNDTESGEVTDSENSSDIPTDESNSDGENTQNPETDNNEEEDNINFIIIYKSQTDITFTITLDNPEAYAIDALRVYCDDENAQIQVDGEFKPIAQESDGTRVVNWSSEDPYTKTYNIRTTSEDAINSFKVVDVRLAGHDKFQSKETEDTDLGNNELHIYKMDDDAYTLNVIENTFEHIKFNITIKDEYKDTISNIKVDGLEMDEELGYWVLEESKEVEISYEYKLEEYNINVQQIGVIYVEKLRFQAVGNFDIAYIENPLFKLYGVLIHDITVTCNYQVYNTYIIDNCVYVYTKMFDILSYEDWFYENIYGKEYEITDNIDELFEISYNMYSEYINEELDKYEIYFTINNHDYIPIFRVKDGKCIIQKLEEKYV